MTSIRERVIEKMKISAKSKAYFDELEKHLNSLACSYVSNVLAMEVLFEKLVEKGILSQEDVTAVRLETTNRYNKAVEEMIAKDKEEAKQ